MHAGTMGSEKDKAPCPQALARSLLRIDAVARETMHGGRTGIGTTPPEPWVRLFATGAGPLSHDTLGAEALL